MLEGLLNRFRTHLQARGLSERTIRAYLSDLHLFTRWFEQDTGQQMEPRVVTSIDLRRYRDHLASTCKPATVNRKLAALSTFFSWARGRGLITEVPTGGLRAATQVELAPRWLSRPEQRALLRAACKGGKPRDAAIIVFLLGTGLRAGEVASLCLSDLSLSPRKGWVELIGKGGKRRRVPLNAEVRRVLAAYLEVRPGSESDHLFLGRNGPLGVPGIYYLVTKYARQAGLEDVTPHTLRHTFAKNLVDAGVSLDQVAMLLRHSSLNTTRVYTTPGAADLERAVAKLP